MPLRRLQLKLNAVVLPLVLVAVGVMAWADYRHEFTSTMDAHGIHVSESRTLGPVPADTAPGAVAARSLRGHVLFGAVVGIALALALNAAVSIVILRPIRRLRDQMDQMARGLWQTRSSDRIPDDELGALVEGFGQLGVQMEAIVRHLLQTERLAATALISTRLRTELAPALEVLKAAVAELHSGHINDPERLANSVARATAAILSALHELDAPFAALANRLPKAASGRHEGAVA